ncbi:hypothetical protein CPB84DRAFT_6553 [Gymnopilus junonius]|uniref:Uncharacterized protein n=1 Tax=Gymnopilus junonius TaxID=109634 RepID=A0A9P5TVK9_GYMJU|nr:hypothetical protein CPB84DRAFT_6553 [Gymnopilus junonius]
MDRRPPYPSVPVDPAEGSPLGNSYQQPHVLDPDYGPQTIHRSDLFFMNSSPHMHTSNKRDPRQQNPPLQLYPYHQQAFQHHFASPPPPPPNRPIASPHNSYPQNPPYYEYRQRAASTPARPPPPVPPPPLPPKPIVYPVLGAATAIPHEFAHYTTPHLPPPPPLPPPPDPQPEESPIEESNELAMVLALSQSESVQRQILEEQLRQKEEEDLAKALAESALLSGVSSHESSNDDYFPQTNEDLLSSKAQYDSYIVRARARSTPEDAVSHATDSSYAEFGGHDKWNAQRSSQVQREETNFLSQQVEQEVEPTADTFPAHDPPAHASERVSSRPLSISSASSLPYTQPSPKSNGFYSAESDLAYTKGNVNSSRPPSPTFVPDNAVSQPTVETVLVFDDEAYARQLAAEEEELARREQYQSEQKKSLGEDPNKQPGEPYLPVYSSLGVQGGQSLDKVISNSSSSSSLSNAGPPSRPIQYPIAGSSEQSELVARPGPSQSELPHFVPILPVVYPSPSLGLHRENESDAHSEASHQSSTRTTASAPISHTGNQAQSFQENLPSKIASGSPVSEGRISGQTVNS